MLPLFLLVPLPVLGRLHTALLKKNGKKLTHSFKFSFLYIDDVISLNNSKSGDFVDRIYSIELGINDTTYTTGSALCLDLHLEIDGNGGLKTKHYDKGDDFNFFSVSLSFICRNIPAAHEVYSSQLVRFSRASGSYQDFVDAGLLLTSICSVCHNHNPVLSPFMT